MPDPAAKQPTERFQLRVPTSLSDLLKAPPREMGEIMISGIARFGATESGDLCFCDREPEETLQAVAQGTIIICSPELQAVLEKRFPSSTCIPVADARSTFIDLGQRLLADNKVGTSSKIPTPLSIHREAEIGENTFIHPETRIDDGVLIGANCVIKRGTWIKKNTIIGDNTVIGCEGINAHTGQDALQRRFPHFAGVIIGENTSIGAGSVVVRGILNSTQIGADSVIGNLCNIGHGVEVRNKVWMSVGCLIGGHSTLGERATLGMGVCIRDNIEIGSDCQIGMGSVVTKPSPPGVSMFGNPAQPIRRIKAGPDR